MDMQTLLVRLAILGVQYRVDGSVALHFDAPRGCPTDVRHHAALGAHCRRFGLVGGSLLKR